MLGIRRLLIVPVLIVAGWSITTRANLLVNGSFEGGTYAFGDDGGADLPVGNTQMTGWTVVINNVAPLIAGNIHSIVPQDGQISLDLQSYSDAPPYGGVSQDISTILGAQYDLSFWIGVHNDVDIAIGPASVMASAGATSQTFTNTLVGPGQQWQEFLLPFTANATTTTITLAGVSTQGGFYIGLDNASVVQVPEPASISMSVGITLLALLRRRRAAIQT